MALLMPVPRADLLAHTIGGAGAGAGTEGGAGERGQWLLALFFSFCNFYVWVRAKTF